MMATVRAGGHRLGLGRCIASISLSRPPWRMGGATGTLKCEAGSSGPLSAWRLQHQQLLQGRRQQGWRHPMAALNDIVRVPPRLMSSTDNIVSYFLRCYSGEYSVMPNQLGYYQQHDTSPLRQVYLLPWNTIATP